LIRGWFLRGPAGLHHYIRVKNLYHNTVQRAINDRFGKPAMSKENASKHVQETKISRDMSKKIWQLTLRDLPAFAPDRVTIIRSMGSLG
jgi:hypothetical protein